MHRRNLFSGAGLCMFVLMAGSASANYTGVGWQVSQSIASNATLANAQAQAGNNNKVTFSSNTINFTSGNNGTVGEFLSSGALNSSPVYTNISGSTLLNTSTNGFLFEFTGTENFTNGQTYNITHDDGVTLIVGGNTVINAPGATGPITSSFTAGAGTSGLQSVVLVYGECCSLPAVLTSNLPVNAVPEPSSVMLFGTVLIGVVSAIRRKMA